MVMKKMLALTFALSAFTFMNFAYCFSDCIGSIVSGSADICMRDLLRSMPIILSFLLSISGLVIAHCFWLNEEPAILSKRVRLHSMTGIVIGVIIPVYVIVMLLAGRYLSIVEGSPSRLYPLDSVIYALLFIAADIAVLRYLKGHAAAANATDDNGHKKSHIIGKILLIIWLLISLYGFCGFFFGIFIMDFTHGYLPYSIAHLLVSLIAFLSIAVRELYYVKLSGEQRRKSMLSLALVSLAVSVAAAAFYFIALKSNLDGPANVGFGILPVAFTASVNLTTLAVVLLPLIVSIGALIKALRLRVE